MHEEIVSLLKIVKKMQNDYPKKKFTLDGRLVGDIGEILAAEKYDFKLYDEKTFNLSNRLHPRLLSWHTHR
jgi:hypothetical protein